MDTSESGVASPSANSDPAVAYRYTDFTEAHYCDVLDLARSRFQFVQFGANPSGPHTYWRHDIDMSPQRALRLAGLERERGVQATYFWSFHAEFYNVLETPVTCIVREIAAMGHAIGLHFDVAWYSAPGHEDIAFERSLLERTVGCAVRAVSFHNPDTTRSDILHENQLAGMINAYGRDIQERYTYCSDSNGYWRFLRLWDVLQDAAVERIHILTHPEWWVPEAMSPRERFARCVRGRADAVSQRYDAQLREFGRANIGTP